MNKPKGMVFDLGDTVLKFVKSDWIATNKKLLGFAENDIDITPGEFNKISEKIYVEWDKDRSGSMFEHGIEAYYRLLFETLDISLSISYEEAADICWNYAHQHEPEDGIYEVLDILAKKGIKTGILSNCTFTAAVLERELEKHGLLDRFSFVISSLDYGIRKPHPHIFNVAARKIGFKPEDIWFAGNKPEIDVRGAVNAGFFPVWYNRPNEPSNHSYNCLEIHSWYEFIDILDSL